MGARPSSFKGGGGRLNGVDAKITGYRFTDQFLGHDFEPGVFVDPKTKAKIEKSHNLYLEVSFLVDGAEEAVLEPLRVSKDYDKFVISEDEQTITMADESPCSFNKNTAAAKFLASLCNPESGDGFPEDRLSDDPDSITLGPIVNTRVRLAKQVNQEATEYAKKQGGTGKRKGKDGKEYNFEDLVVSEVLELPAEKAAKGGKAAKPATAAKGKAAAKAAEPEVEEVSLEDLSKTTLIEIVAEAGGSIAKSKLSMKVLTKLMKHPQREDVRKLIFTDEFLAREDGWSYNKAKQTVTVE